MTAAILQFNPMHIRKLNDQHLQQQEEDMINVSFDNAYRNRMVDLLNTEHPFRAVRLAESFNEANGFELIPVGMIRKWKKEIMKNGNVEIKFENRQNDFLKNDFLENEFCQNEIVNIKKWKYEKAFQDLLEN